MAHILRDKVAFFLGKNDNTFNSLRISITRRDFDYFVIHFSPKS